MKSASFVFDWVFGILLLFMGTIFIIGSSLGGILLIATSLLYLPPVANFISSKTKKQISKGAKALVALILFITFYIVTS